jgi:Na+/phosphate symporter
LEENATAEAVHTLHQLVHTVQSAVKQDLATVRRLYGPSRTDDEMGSLLAYWLDSETPADILRTEVEPLLSKAPEAVAGSVADLQKLSTLKPLFTEAVKRAMDFVNAQHE